MNICRSAYKDIVSTSRLRESAPSSPHVSLGSHVSQPVSSLWIKTSGRLRSRLCNKVCQWTAMAVPEPVPNATAAASSTHSKLPSSSRKQHLDSLPNYLNLRRLTIAQIDFQPYQRPKLCWSCKATVRRVNRVESDHWTDCSTTATCLVTADSSAVR